MFDRHSRPPDPLMASLTGRSPPKRSTQLTEERMHVSADPYFSDIARTERGGDVLQIHGRRHGINKTQERESVLIRLALLHEVFHGETLQTLQTQLNEAVDIDVAIEIWDHALSLKRAARRTQSAQHSPKETWKTLRNSREVTMETYAFDHFKFPETDRFLRAPNLPRLVSYRKAGEMKGRDRSRIAIAPPTPLAKYSIMITGQY